ncbi:MAG: SNF2-related protein [Myxococcales bacterium]|nr:SNF2-related protein [Myxococcales bacterium]
MTLVEPSERAGLPRGHRFDERGIVGVVSHHRNGPYHVPQAFGFAGLAVVNADVALREAVRAEATERTWTQGVSLARDKRVVGKARSRDEIELDVRVPGKPTPFHVILNPVHDEWECDCATKEAVCSHVVAAVLATEQADGQLPTSSSAGASIRYLLEPDPGGVRVERVLVAKDSVEPFRGSLMSLIGTGKAGHIASVEADLLVDQLLGVRAGPVTGEKLDRILAALADARDVRWRGDPVTTSGEPVMPRAVVEDVPGGVRVRIEPDPQVREVPAVGMVRMEGNILRPIGAVDLTGPRLEKLPQKFDVPRSALPELLGKTLPALAQRIEVDVRATGLPKVGNKEEPRMEFDAEQDGDRLIVMPRLVYGEPARARVDGQVLVHLNGALPIRDHDAERRLVHRLRDELNLVPGRRVEMTGREAFAMQQGLSTWLRTDAKSASAARAISLEIKIDIAGNKLEVEVAGGGRTASIGAALRAWQAGVDLVPLSGGGWGRVPMEWFNKHGERVADLLATRSGDHRVPMYALPDLAKLCEDLDRPPPPELDRLRPLLAGFNGLPSTKLPKGFAGELRPYQQLGVDWLAFCRNAGLGCVLADDMGLGKTIQALAVMKGRTLVVAPKSVLFNWLAEAKKFRPDLDIAIYAGTRRELDSNADIVLTSYPILRNDIDALAQETWDTIVLDESQTIKNPDSQVARAAYRLKGTWRVTLSGTPVENRLEELWSQLHFTNPGLLGGRADFQERWAEPVALGDAAAAARLRDRIRPFVLRRMKSEVARELPPRTDAIMYVELDESERITYDAIRAATQRDIVKLLEAGGGVMAALEALLRLRQAACHTALLPAGMRSTDRKARADAEAEPPSADTPLASSKLERLLEALEDAVADGHRALVFSQWTSLLDLIEPHLNAAKIKFVRLDGSTVDRQGVVGEFQSEAGPPVMLLSLKAGGTGLNLTAADHVFLVDPWWNPAVEDQAADRAHRIGQDKPVMVYRMVARDTVEERILELQERKRGLANAALSEAGAATSITRDDLLALLA